jgi:dienelactone hydrolase
MTQRSSFVASALLVLVFAAAAAAVARAEEGKPAEPSPAAGQVPRASPATRPVVAPYPVDHDAPLDAQERLVAEAEDHVQYRVEFNGIKRDRVPAFLYVPKDGKAQHPAVLLQYGSGGNKTTNYIVALANQFVARGFVVLTIDVPNRGERRDRRQRTLWESLAGGGTFLQTLGDYSRAVDYLVSRDDVDERRIGYAGISLGAITGLTFVAHEPRVAAMVSIVGGANLLGMLKVEVDPEVRKTSQRIDPFYHVGLIAPRPLMLLNATHDQLVPRFFGEQLHKAAGEHGKKVWVETDHFFTGVDRFAVLETVIDFMQESLPTPAPAGADPDGADADGANGADGGAAPRQ